MEQLLQAIAADPERFTDGTYLPCGLRAVADALIERGARPAPEVVFVVVDFLGM